MGMLEDDEIESTIDTLRGHYKDRLTGWEREFLDSIETQYDATGHLTERQKAKLDQIFDRCSGGGQDGGASYTKERWR